MPIRTSSFSAVAAALSIASFASPVASQLPAVPEVVISAEFPYESKYVEVLGSKMHFVESGDGDPILFLHGNPTSSYLWRNVMPHLESQGRVIAVDLIGMGKSDKPELDYTFPDHSRYLEAFIAELGLERITLVVHDWGSTLGFHYARRHQSNVIGIAFMEAIVPPAMPMPSVEAMGPAAPIFQAMRTEGQGEQMVLEQNFFVEQLLPGAVARGLGEAEMAVYREPYPTPASRKPTLVWPRELPIGGVPARNVEVVEAIGEWMAETNLPMIHLWARPGALNPEPVVEALVQKIPHLQSTFIGTGIHFLQEDHPEIIGRAIADWRRREVQTARNQTER